MLRFVSLCFVLIFVLGFFIWRFSPGILFLSSLSGNSQDSEYFDFRVWEDSKFFIIFCFQYKNYIKQSTIFYIFFIFLIMFPFLAYVSCIFSTTYHRFDVCFFACVSIKIAFFKCEVALCKMQIILTQNPTARFSLFCKSHLCSYRTDSLTVTLVRRKHKPRRNNTRHPDAFKH